MSLKNLNKYGRYMPSLLYAIILLLVSSHPNDGSAAKLLSNVVELQSISSETVNNQSFVPSQLIM